ncbi:MAG: HD domain-containing protein [Verrucomicrobiota bacterium]|nr:HD domain-containing protein [Verrucomicrobiota bacterium]
MELHSLTSLKRATQAGRVEAKVHVQIEAIAKKETREQKPYWELIVADAESKMTLRAWSDSPGYKQCDELAQGGFLEIAGEFASSQFGVEAKRWTCRSLSTAERDALLAGPAELREKQRADCEYISQQASALHDPRLKSLTASFFSEFGERFKRTAAARTYHHARRGGLVEHVAQMLRAANALANVYSELNRDLLAAGVIFHDCGKLWENALPENGFAMPYNERGEMIGHITIGAEVVNALWRKLDLAPWSELKPASEDVRLHLLHLIASHHGAREFGSPVDPKTPEAFALHHIDNLDAKLEMLAAAYENASLIAPGIFERVRPLPGPIISALAPVVSASE